jgi:hypothetical protein
MNNHHIVCPVDQVVVNENRVRITAFFVLLMAIFYLFVNNWFVIAFLLTDFFLRIFDLSSYSPLAVLSGFVVKHLGIKNKPVDRAPKRFAAIVGFVFLALILITLLTHFVLTSQVLAVVVLAFASLEAFVGFCAGCYAYSLLRT